MKMVVKIKDKIENVCISTNSICNFICRYCYFYNPENSILLKTSGLPEKKLTENEIKTILDKIYDYSIENNLKKKIKVIFVGSGEPLLSWGEISLALEDFNNEGKQKEVKLYMVTNGTLLI